MSKINQNLMSGKFKEKELQMYGELDESDINVIMEYQKKLPCLQNNNKEWIDGRVLHEQLVKFQKVDKEGVPTEGTKFATWIERRIEKYDFIEDTDYKLDCSNLGNQDNKHGGDRKSLAYNISTDMAKNLCMIENNEIGRLSRKYFIAVEKAFKSRYTRNVERQNTIDTFHDLKEIVFVDVHSDNKLKQYIPNWWKFNTYAYELHLINEVIIGMSSKKYKKLHDLSGSSAIRNTFTESQLEDYTLLQSKSAEYLEVNNIWDTNERFELLNKFYKIHKNKNSAKGEFNVA